MLQVGPLAVETDDVRDIRCGKMTLITDDTYYLVLHYFFFL